MSENELDTEEVILKKISKSADNFKWKVFFHKKDYY